MATPGGKAELKTRQERVATEEAEAVAAKRPSGTESNRMLKNLVKKHRKKRTSLARGK